MMQAARFVLTPYYEIMDSMVPLRRLFLDDTASVDTSGRFRGRQMVEFSVRYDHSLLLCESKRQKIASFNVRCVIRFCKVSEIRCDEHGIRVKDAFPLHLTIDLNNTIISLPSLLPNDRSGKDGRRFPRPVDLAEGLIDNPIITNRMYLTWVQDDGKNDEYYFAMFLVRLRSCDELSGILLSQHISAVSSTLSLVYDQCCNLNGTVDDDLMLVNTSINTSLSCPVSRGRIEIPIRGQNCNHLQCFDCMTYLVMNFKKPTWLCPVCDKKIFFCYIEVDGLIYNILKDERSKSVENIQFNKSGQWRPTNKVSGAVTDDRPFYDIADLVSASQSNVRMKPATVLQALNDSIGDYKVEKYLQQILNSSKVNHPINPQRSALQPNRTSTINTANISQQIKSHYASCATNPSHAMSQHIIHQQHQPFGHVSTAPVPAHLSKMCHEQTANFHLNSQPALSRYHHNYMAPSCHIPPRLSSSMTGPAGTANLQITSVTSMAAHHKHPTKDVIVISDDESEDAASIDKTATNSSKPTHKRPSMVSSVPSEFDSSKHMKFVDGPSVYSPRPHSASLNGVYTKSQLLSKLCKCTPGRVCPLHSDNLAYINNMITSSHHAAPIVSGSSDMNMPVHSSLSNNIHCNMHSHNQIPILTGPDILSQSPVLAEGRQQIFPNHGMTVISGPSISSQSHMSSDGQQRIFAHQSLPNASCPSIPSQSPILSDGRQQIYPHQGMSGTNISQSPMLPDGRQPSFPHQSLPNATCPSIYSQSPVLHDGRQPMFSHHSLPNATCPSILSQSSVLSDGRHNTFPNQTSISNLSSVLNDGRHNVLPHQMMSNLIRYSIPTHQVKPNLSRRSIPTHQVLPNESHQTLPVHPTISADGHHYVYTHHKLHKESRHSQQSQSALPTIHKHQTSHNEIQSTGQPEGRLNQQPQSTLHHICTQKTISTPSIDYNALQPNNVMQTLLSSPDLDQSFVNRLNQANQMKLYHDLISGGHGHRPSVSMQSPVLGINEHARPTLKDHTLSADHKGENLISNHHLKTSLDNGQSQWSPMMAHYPIVYKDPTDKICPLSSYDSNPNVPNMFSNS